MHIKAHFLVCWRNYKDNVTSHKYSQFSCKMFDRGKCSLFCPNCAENVAHLDVCKMQQCYFILRALEISKNMIFREC